MSNNSSSFHLLDERIQRFLWAESWESLRDAQEKAIPLIIRGDQDVVISAATAAGKTEAAFLPALTHMLAESGERLIIYVSPLKALINDQFGRLDRLCEQLDVPVWPWHGDISSTVKTKFLKQRHGVLLITPESLEALLCNRGTSVAAIFEHASFFIVDELHAFIGSERGKQLQSLMHRIEESVGRNVPRIGLSATLGDMSLAGNFLRPNGMPIQVSSVAEGSAELKVLVKGYEEPLVVSSARSHDEDDEQQEPISPANIAEHLFKTLRGSNNLIFPNSRRQVEQYTYLLGKKCEEAHIPNEFWPHHGSLSKEIRAETEAALKQKEVPANAICTNTLELGIDIGAVKSVAQIGPPPSVASLRQRLGRSGRRKGESAILRAYCVEDALGPKSTVLDNLRLGTLQTIAMISLLVDKWFEPPRTQGVHLSTMIQQLLSAVAQRGGATAQELYALFCKSGGPFHGLSTQEFIELLRHLGLKELLMQDSSGTLLHGRIGEKLVNHYSFYAAFSADEEFRLVTGGKTLGTLPVDQMLQAGQRILFAGRTWLVEDIDEEQKTIYVVQTKGGVPPQFSGGTGRVHTKVRSRMRELLQSSLQLPYLDETARRFLTEARKCYTHNNLASEFAIDQGREVFLLTWLGDSANEAIACLLNRRGFLSAASGPGVEVQKGQQSTQDVQDALADIAIDDAPPLEMLLADVKNLGREKWDWALPDNLLRKAYASLHLNVDEGLEWVKRHSQPAPSSPTS